MKNRTEISEIKNRKSIEKTQEIKSWFFGKISKINKLLARLRIWMMVTQGFAYNDSLSYTCMYNEFLCVLNTSVKSF